MNNKGIGLVICLISIAIGCTPLQQHKSASRSRIETGNNISIGFSNFIITQENSVENQNQTSIQENCRISS